MFRSALISTVSMTVLFSAAPAMAHSATTNETVDVIQVTGTPIRDSQAAALNQKRAADNVADIIAADTIGRFPDQNLADSLGRLPGLAIERDQGQARFINFRGAPFRWTAIAFDGIDVLGAENGRIPRFDSFPSVITSSVEANKAITPDMPGEAVSGFININTFNPFDREGFSASGEAGYGEQELGGGPINKYNFRASWSGDQFGLVVFGSHNRRKQITDNREFDLELDSSGELILNEVDFRNYIVEREDNAYGGTAEFRPDGAVSRVFFSTLFSEFIDREQRNQYVFDLAGGAGAIGGAVAPGDTGYQPLALVNRLLEDGRYHNSTWTNTLGLDGEFGDWRMEGRLNYTETRNSTFLPIPYSVAGQAAVSYDITNVEDPQLNVFAPFSQTEIGLGALSYATTLGLVVDATLDTESYKLKGDVERDVSLFGRDSVIGFGLQYDAREASGYGVTQAIGGFPASVDIASFDDGTPWRSDFNNSIGGTYYDNEGLRQAWSDAAGGLAVTPADDQLIALEEDIIAFYGMATVELSRGSVVFGARVEHTDYTSEGPQLQTAYSDDYVTVLPSLHFNFDLTDTLKFRASASTGISRPTYNELRASASVDPTSQTVIGGNPTLDPETTWGGDLALEWYFAPASILSAGVFHRTVDNVIYSDSTDIDGGVYLPSAAGEVWTLSGPVNGSNGSLSGLEINLIGQASFLPEALSGFGASANLTLLDSEFETQSGVTFSLPGASDMIWNASVFYERFGLSARLNYQYRDAWLSTTENDSLAEYWDAQQRLDASLRYSLPTAPGGVAVTLFANANNLTDEVDVRYAGQRATPNQVEGYGRRFLAGVRLDF